MKLSELLRGDDLHLSFEVFPPKTDTAFASVKAATEEIAELHPSFMSVTYGAGGGTSRYTLDIAKTIKEQHNVPTIAHLTCVSSTKETVREKISQIKAAGIENVMALRGDLTPEMMLSQSFFYLHPDKFFEFYRAHMLYPDAEPNAAHRALYALERAGKLRGVVTQNIDGLHKKAGNRLVYEVHGSVWENYCMDCNAFYGLEKILNTEGIPRCECGGTVKPDVVLYEEGLNQRTLTDSVEAIARADMLIIGGTSLNVYPAAGLINYYRGRKLVLLNKSPVARDLSAGLVITDPIGEVLSQL